MKSYCPNKKIISNIYSLFFIFCLILSLNQAAVSAQEINKNTTKLDKTTTSAPEKNFWITDFSMALEMAKNENKLLFIDFTGSDWCRWCIKLDEEVFSKKYFQEEININFIPVLIDYPQYKSTPEIEKKKRKELAIQFQIKEFPTIILADNSGKIFGRLGYLQGGENAYITHINKILLFKDELDILEEKAKNKKGIEKAKILHKLVKKRINANLNIDNDSYINTIMKLDKDNKAGLKEIYECKKEIEKIGIAMQEGKDPDEGLGEVDALIKIYGKNNKLHQDLLFLKSIIYARGKNNFKGAEKYVLKAIEAAPKSDLVPALQELLIKLKNAK